MVTDQSRPTPLEGTVFPLAWISLAETNEIPSAATGSRYPASRSTEHRAREHSAQSPHHPARGISGPSWFNFPFLKHCLLLPKEQILRCKRAARPESNSDKTTEIEKHDHRSQKKCWKAARKPTTGHHERSGSHVTTLQDPSAYCRRCFADHSPTTHPDRYGRSYLGVGERHQYPGS